MASVVVRRLTGWMKITENKKKLKFNNWVAENVSCDGEYRKDYSRKYNSGNCKEIYFEKYPQHPPKYLFTFFILIF